MGTPSEAAEIEQSARDLLARSECLAAYDLLRDAPATEGSAGARLDYLRVLALARAGSPHQAISELERCGLEETVGDLPAALAEDIAVLRARLSKDHAWGTSATSDLASAAELYEAVYRRFNRPFACINAATLRLLAGDRPTAEALARSALALVDRDAGDGYWDAATQAEAQLVLGKMAAVEAALTLAAAAAPDDVGARATTRRQLRRLCDALALDADAVLAPIANPAVLHFCGHRLALPGTSGRFSADEVGRVRQEVDAWLDSQHIGDAWGSLASGADMIIAEALHDRGIPFHVILPFSAAEFEATSVADSGDDWVERFRRDLGWAATVTVSCDSPYLGDDDLYAFASDLAMGQALNRARLLDAVAIQLAVWDGEPGDAPAGTPRDVGVWASTGETTHVIETRGRPGGATISSRKSHSRDIRPVLFGDIQGFSRLDDQQILRFVEQHFERIGGLLDSFGADIVYRNTWGDGLFLVCSTAPIAAHVALEMQELLDTIELADVGLPSDLTMRLAGHAAPLLRMDDPVRHIPAFFGRELTRAARIEPGTPPGEVYVSSAFASLLALEGDDSIVPEYVGHLMTAKSFETIPLYVLRRRH